MIKIGLTFKSDLTIALNLLYMWLTVLMDVSGVYGVTLMFYVVTAISTYLASNYKLELTLFRSTIQNKLSKVINKKEDIIEVIIVKFI